MSQASLPAHTLQGLPSKLNMVAFGGWSLSTPSPTTFPLSPPCSSHRLLLRLKYSKYPSCLRAFAHAVPTAWASLPPDTAAPSPPPSLPSRLCSNVILPGETFPPPPLFTVLFIVLQLPDIRFVPVSGSPPLTVSSQKAGSTLLCPLVLQLEVGNALNYEKGSEKAWNRNSSFSLLTPLLPKHCLNPGALCP